MALPDNASGDARAAGLSKKSISHKGEAKNIQTRFGAAARRRRYSDLLAQLSGHLPPSGSRTAAIGSARRHVRYKSRTDIATRSPRRRERAVREARQCGGTGQCLGLWIA